jgi:hypothetical protein
MQENVEIILEKNLYSWSSRKHKEKRKTTEKIAASCCSAELKTK